jgi:hypothetical protein
LIEKCIITNLRHHYTTGPNDIEQRLQDKPLEKDEIEEIKEGITPYIDIASRAKIPCDPDDFVRNVVMFREMVEQDPVICGECGA